MEQWTEEKLEILVDLVRDERSLWDKGCPEYYLRDYNLVKWNALADILGSTGFSAQQEWGKLKRRYMNYKNSQAPTSSAAQSKRKTNKFFLGQKMTFLNDSLKHNKTLDSIGLKNQENFDKDSDEGLKNENNLDPIPTTSHRQHEPHIATQPTHPQKKRQLIILSDDEEDEVSQVQTIKKNTKRQKMSANDSDVQMVARAIIKSVEKNDELVRSLVQSSRTSNIPDPNSSSAQSDDIILNHENIASNSIPSFENDTNIPPETKEIISKFADFVAEKARGMVMKLWDDFLEMK